MQTLFYSKSTVSSVSKVIFFCVCSVGRKESQAAKLHCILCYFERAALDKCNLSAVITFRRQVKVFVHVSYG